MSSSQDLVDATRQNAKEAFNSFTAHASGTRIETKQKVLDVLRATYPDHHVTLVDAGNCSLLEFAKAGKAESTLDTKDEVFNVAREWRAVGTGIEKKEHPGQLQDSEMFARFSYTWKEKHYIVYHLIFRDPMCGATRLFYILQPRATATITDGHCQESDELVLAAGKWTSELHEEIFVFDNGYWDKSKELWKAVSGSSWDDVILDPEMKQGLIQDVQGFFDNKDVYSQYAVPWKRGIILHGIPGNGKTVSIKALINALYARPDQIASLYVKSFQTKSNTAQYSIRQIFLQARRSAPCLLIFEDLDSLVQDDIRSYFLNEVDGLESNDGILMIGSTNHLDKLDPAIAKRPSRFDRKYHFKLPGSNERILYADYWRTKLTSRNKDIDFPEDLCPVLAELTEGFSFAYLKELFVMSLLSLVRGFKGDDFEIVESEEADSAPEEENPATTTAAATSSSTDKAKEAEAKDADLCTCAKTCNKCGKPLPATTESTDADKDKKPVEKKSGTTGGGSEAAKKTHSVPVVDVPSHLADNVLFKVVKHHVRILLAEMDNTKPEEWKSGRKEVGGKDGAAAYHRMRVMRAMMASS